MPPELKNAAFMGMGICGLMVVFNLIVARNKGVSRLFLAGAFAMFGIDLFLFTNDAAPEVLLAIGALVFLLLVADAVSRMAKKERAKL